MKVLPQQQDMFQDEYAGTWQKCLDEIVSQVENERAKEAFLKIRFESYDNTTHVLTLVIPHNNILEWIESDKVSGFFYAYISRYFNRPKLNYYIPKKITATTAPFLAGCDSIATMAMTISSTHRRWRAHR